MLDLVFGNHVPPQQDRLYLNDGAGNFTDVTATRMPPDSDHTYALAVGDVDGDGDPDLVFGNYRAQSRLYLNSGTGNFIVTTPHMPRNSDLTVAVALGDVDGDGSLDAMFGNFNAQVKN